MFHECFYPLNLVIAKVFRGRGGLRPEEAIEAIRNHAAAVANMGEAERTLLRLGMLDPQPDPEPIVEVDPPPGLTPIVEVEVKEDAPLDDSMPPPRPKLQRLAQLTSIDEAGSDEHFKYTKLKYELHGTLPPADSEDDTDRATSTSSSSISSMPKATAPSPPVLPVTQNESQLLPGLSPLREDDYIQESQLLADSD